MRRFANIEPIVDDLKISYAIVKGEVLSKQIYGKTVERACSDIDFLISRSCLKIVENKLADNGFRVYQLNEATLSRGLFYRIKLLHGLKRIGYIFTKPGASGTDKVWFYDMKADGFSLDEKRSEIADNDIPDIIQRFHHLEQETTRERTEQSFFVPEQEIVENGYDLSISNTRNRVCGG